MRPSATRRAFRYATTGLSAEVAFTAICGGQWHLPGHTQLWLVPVYALGGLLGYEPLKRALANQSRWARCLAYGGFVVFSEWASGELLKCLLGACPWAYDSEQHVVLIGDTANPAYLPFWGAMLLAAEQL